MKLNITTSQHHTTTDNKRHKKNTLNDNNFKTREIWHVERKPNSAVGINERAKMVVRMVTPLTKIIRKSRMAKHKRSSICLARRRILRMTHFHRSQLPVTEARKSQRLLLKMLIRMTKTTFMLKICPKSRKRNYARPIRMITITCQPSKVSPVTKVVLKQHH